MVQEFQGQRYLLNLIDTPGHVDFAWEVSRSLTACQGALLLVDATRAFIRASHHVHVHILSYFAEGVQAQSLSVFHVAKERGLKIIPVLNKVFLRITLRYGNLIQQVRTR